MRLGAREAKVNVSFSYLVAVQITDETNVAESPSPTAANRPGSGTLKSASAGESASSASPADNESVEDLVNHGIEKGKEGDLDGAIVDFTRAIELNPKDAPLIITAPKPNGLRRMRPAPLPTTPEPSNWALRTRLRITTAVTPERRIMTGMAQLLIIPAQSNSNPITPALTTIALSRSRKREMRSVPRPTSRLPGNSIQNWLTTGRPRIQKAILLLELRQSVFWMASSSSTCPLISLATLMISKNPKTVAKFSGPDGAWGTVLRGTHGLTPDKLDGYLKMRVAEYSKGFKWLPKDSHLQWLKKDIVAINGRKWADWSFVPMLKGKKDYSHNPVYLVT